jgi:hypothetical protein
MHGKGRRIVSGQRPTDWVRAHSASIRTGLVGHGHAPVDLVVCHYSFDGQSGPGYAGACCGVNVAGQEGGIYFMQVAG